MISFSAYLERVARRKVAHKVERMGQAYFNQLHEDMPEIANQIRGTEVDPFYDDVQIGNFLNALLKYYGV